MWGNIEMLSVRILDDLFSGRLVAKMRRKGLAERHIVFENTILLNRDLIIYVEMIAAVKQGDIRTVMNIMAHWAVMMRGTSSMPMYAHALIKVRHMVGS